MSELCVKKIYFFCWFIYYPLSKSFGKKVKEKHGAKVTCKKFNMNKCQQFINFSIKFVFAIWKHKFLTLFDLEINKFLVFRAEFDV